MPNVEARIVEIETYVRNRRPPVRVIDVTRLTSAELVEYAALCRLAGMIGMDAMTMADVERGAELAEWLWAIKERRDALT